jgi:hypothetical protein
MTFARRRAVLRGAIRSALRSFLSQERRTALKRQVAETRKRLGPVLTAINGTFSTEELVEELRLRISQDFEILMVHSSFDTFSPCTRDRPRMSSGL